MKDVYATPHHPAAALFPMMSEAELQELAADIKAHGQQQQIILCQGKVLDGRNRLAACKIAGVKPMIADMSAPGGKVYGRAGEALTPTDYVVSHNLHRRHLTAEQKREVIAAVLKQDPKRSNRRVAEQTKADHKTVGTVRKEMEGRGEIPHVEARADTKGRQQPSRKRAPPTPRPTSEINQDGPSDPAAELTVEEFAQHWATICEDADLLDGMQDRLIQRLRKLEDRGVKGLDPEDLSSGIEDAVQRAAHGDFEDWDNPSFWPDAWMRFCSRLPVRNEEDEGPEPPGGEGTVKDRLGRIAGNLFGREKGKRKRK
jgi:ParB/Sulfiredoxin domain